MTTSLEEKSKSDDRFRSRVGWSNIPPSTYLTHRLQTFLPMKGAEEAYQAALDYLGEEIKHPFLTFTGQVGRGKTHLALGIGWHWLEVKCELVKYFQAEALLDNLRQGFHARSEESLYSFDQQMDQLKQVPLLILDDLGVEQSTEWARAKLDLIVDHRYLAGLRTVVTTNLLLTELEPRVASRLNEGVTVVLKCGDYRERKGKK